MTILEASAKLYEWFSKNDCATLHLGAQPKGDDFKDIVILTDNERKDRAAILLALQSFERAELVKCHTFGENASYVLLRPFAAFEQTIAIQPNLAIEISKVINDFCDRIKDKTDYCDPARITAADIRSLVLIITHFLSFETSGQDSENE
jgi:hypothetical protein